MSQATRELIMALGITMVVMALCLAFMSEKDSCEVHEVDTGVFVEVCTTTYRTTSVTIVPEP